jgi:hypothetical protein
VYPTLRRTVDGDEVVAQLLPVAMWYKQYRFMSKELQEK